MPADTNTRQIIARPVVDTTYGPVRGSYDGTANVWRGIRYAAAPVGDRRWRAPQPPEVSHDVMDATTFGPVCPQPRSPIPLGPGTRADEDCLFLNIWSPPGVSAGDARPVMVWVHGGAYVLGAGSQPLYDGTTLTSSGVIVVTINYRLGAFGFADFSSFGQGFETNLGLRDVLAALRWVRDNIAAFGGDPERVTLFGESAGAGIITTLLAVPEAAGLFCRAIAQSSPATTINDGARARKVAELLLEQLGTTAAQASHLPTQALVDATAHAFDHVPTANPGRLAFAPTVDGDFLPDYPVNLARAGKTHAVPLVIGTNRDEAALFRFMKSPLMPIAPKAIQTMFEEIAEDQPGLQLPTEAQIASAYAGMRARARGMGVARDVGFRMPTLWFAEGHSSVAHVHLYRFDWATTVFKVIGLGAAHATELVYVWGNLVAGPRDFTFKLGGLKTGRALSDRVRTRWTNFAADGVPRGLEGEPYWPAYRANDRRTLVIDRSDRIVDDLDRSIRLTWGNEVLSLR
jgi:para-nitrobenzyl esterase